MNARDIEKKAFDDFGKWANQWRIDHPEDEDLDDYTLSLMFPDNQKIHPTICPGWCPDGI